MVFTTHIFLFYFLPLFLAVYFVLPRAMAEPMDYSGELRLLWLVAAVVCLPDDVHHRDGLHVGQGHHSARRDRRPNGSWPSPPAW